MAKLKDIVIKEEGLTGGHRLCAGCGASIIMRQALLAAKNPVVVGVSTGCLEVSTTIYPYSAWKCSYIHNAFENSAATVSGVETAYRAFKKKGKIQEDMRFIAIGGDGGTYDIGLQSLSGALERGHRMLYICYDNGAYMNTGIQRSSATPYAAWTTTSPVGKVNPGKLQYRKDLTGIVAAHNIPYVAQASPHNFKDLTQKVENALAADGPSFLNIISPCPRGWRHPSEDGIKMAKIGVQSCFWPLYEIDEGAWKLNYKPRRKLPIEDWLKPQGRFKHLFKEENKGLIKEIQDEIDREWEKLLVKCGETSD